MVSMSLIVSRASLMLPLSIEVLSANEFAKYLISLSHETSSLYLDVDSFGMPLSLEGSDVMTVKVSSP